MCPLKKDRRIYFFFPFYHTGGAEKVHLQVAAAVGGSDSVIFFTKKSADGRFLDAFKRTGCEIKDISKFTDNKAIHFINLIYRGIVTGYINNQKQKPIVFNGQCNFGYKISPWINSRIPQVELIHSLNTFSYIRIPFLPFIKKTVMISKKRIADHKILYEQVKIPSQLLNKISYIPNAVELPVNKSAKDDTRFTVLYAGRATKEKRVYLVARIAKQVYDRKENIQFEIAGDLQGSLVPEKYSFIEFHGNINSETELNHLYSKAHLLLLTSATEGFPMVIMEAMAHGCAILSTAVGDIPFHVKNYENGFLFTSVTDESVITHEAVEKIVWLKNNRAELHRIMRNNSNYAQHNFGIQRFNKDYTELFFSVKQPIEAT
jgi:glycosyltransferase involved in cell wall biosynthesis